MTKIPVPLDLSQKDSPNWKMQGHLALDNIRTWFFVIYLVGCILRLFMVTRCCQQFQMVFLVCVYLVEDEGMDKSFTEHKYLVWPALALIENKKMPAQKNVTFNWPGKNTFPFLKMSMDHWSHMVVRVSIFSQNNRSVILRGKKSNLS